MSQMTNLVNLTPHTIKVAGDDGQVICELPPSGKVARVSANAEIVEQLVLDGGFVIDVVKTSFGEVTGLPEPFGLDLGYTPVYVVSSLVAQAVGRADVVSPDTGPTAIRENGQIVAVKRFQRF